MEENKKTKYFIRILRETEEPDLDDLEALVEDNPELKKLGAVLLMANKKMRH
ncbi:MAG: hypothetical protein WC399_03270 [Bacilli bacterium]